ncbi:MAG: phosphate acyltransferase PlsX [Micavibrio aeruginosavorus]|uniref:Phosphate acyltransferase n=1 Tax=Micavibrio aeruginosavorus TaxID=349221 RepID=A0A7T5R0D8_9BACT|nr:MAG: phosphate acyltransferase PlsX [Micavibrio aeruginosavorus]
MTKPLIIALDAMGGDFGPEIVVSAASLALAQLGQGVRFQFYGREDHIRKHLNADQALLAASEVIHTDKIISSDERPSIALRNGKDSSMRLAIDAVKDGRADAVVSAGNTGALMATAKMVLKCLPGISRPAIASVFPTRSGDIVMLDLGANVSCDAEILTQFAVLGAVYARVVKGVPTPTVGLLNIGSEDIKGHDEVRAAAAILSSIKFPGRYHGFVEGDDIPKGEVDVVVTDGFTGNVAIKVAEGVSEFITHMMKDAFKSSLLAKLGALLAYGALKRMKKRLDPRVYNGGMFLGLNGICVKSHGGMNAFGFSSAILVAANLVRNDYNRRVAQEIEQVMNQESFFSAVAAGQGGNSA